LRARTAGQKIARMAHPVARDTDLIPISAAARLLGVSVSSLRAWAAAGRVPHERTPGGHRRFDRAVLREWMEARGARVPEHDPSHPVHLVPGRITPRPRAAAAIGQAAPRIADEATALVADGRPRSRRMSTALRARLLEQAETLARALATGDLAPCIREAEWRAFRDGAADVPATRPMGEARALARAAERAAAAAGLEGDDLATCCEALDRLTAHAAAGLAAGRRSRRSIRSGQRHAA
jgi:excisionase family DNA binding protein